MPAASATNRNSWRWVWYTVIGVCVVIAATLWAFYSPDKMSHVYDRWAKLTIYTLGVFGSLLKWGWRYRTVGKFWILFLIFLVGHCVIFASLFLPVLSGHGPSSNLMLGLFGATEVVVFATLVALAMRERF